MNTTSEASIYEISIGGLLVKDLVRKPYSHNEDKGYDCVKLLKMISNHLNVSIPEIERLEECREHFNINFRPMIEKYRTRDRNFKLFDILIFALKKNYDHMGFYLKFNKFLHCNPERGVSVSVLNDFWLSRLKEVLRIV